MFYVVVCMLVVLGLVALRVLYPYARILWLLQVTDFYAGRMAWSVGFGTAWILWLVGRMTASLANVELARDCAKDAWLQVRTGKVDGAELHLRLLQGFRDAFAQAGIRKDVADVLVSIIEQEASRREEGRILVHVDFRRSFDILSHLLEVLSAANAASSGPKRLDGRVTAVSGWQSPPFV
jgi:hypothetical protein